MDEYISNKTIVGALAGNPVDALQARVLGFIVERIRLGNFETPESRANAILQCIDSTPELAPWHTHRTSIDAIAGGLQELIQTAIDNPGGELYRCIAEGREAAMKSVAVSKRPLWLRILRAIFMPFSK